MVNFFRFLHRRCLPILLWPLLVAFAETTSGATRAKANPPATSNLYGQNYLSLPSVAAKEKLKVQMDNRTQAAFMTSRWTKVIVPFSGRKLAINDITIWLSFPVVNKAGTLYISEKDVNGVIIPLLRPKKPAKPSKIKTIVISPGHGGKDPGNTFSAKFRAGKNVAGASGVQQEKKYTMLLAKTLQGELQRNGFTVHLVRDGDDYLHPEKHAEYANKMKADLFISLHFNSASDTSAKGVEVFALTPVGCPPTNGGEISKRSPGNRNDPQNVLLAYEIQKALVQNVDMADRGMRRAGFLVLRNIYMPGVLVEAGFMSNSEDMRKITQAGERRKMSNAIINGVLAYKRLMERGAVIP
ncbi:MAG: N-acetylmuramoyl-L-alanine amidase family protein [Verrucomicrobiales bacterium]